MTSLERAFDRYEADLGALTGDLQAPFTLPAVDRAQVQAQQFREAQAGEQRRGHEGEVTFGPGVACLPGAGGDGFEEALGRALALEGLGCPGRDFGLGHGCHRVTDDHVVGHQEAEELVPGGPGPGDAGRGVGVRVGGKRPAQALRRHLAEAQLLGIGAGVGCQLGRDGHQVTSVGGFGVGRALQRLPGHEEVLEELHQASTRFGLGERQARTWRRCAGTGGPTGRPRTVGVALWHGGESTISDA